MKNFLLFFSIFVAFFLFVAFESRTEASVRFVSGGNTGLDCGTLPNLTTFTMAGSFTLQALPTTLIERIMDNTVSQGYLAVTGGSALPNRSYRIQVNRATTNCNANSPTSSLPAVGSRMAVFGTYSEADGCRLYEHSFGSSTAPLVEMVKAPISASGTGATSARVAHGAEIGGRTNATNAGFPGDLHWVAIWNRILTPKEMMVAARRPWLVRGGNILLLFPGLEGRVSSTDYSGFKRGYSGTCIATGTTALMSVQPTPGIFGVIKK